MTYGGRKGQRERRERKKGRKREKERRKLFSILTGLSIHRTEEVGGVTHS